ncbi:MAG: aspartyl protease family protein [Bacteroidetes bacterium]|nr:aspartyl protease family protein [Bacteroidota bacterium]MBS1929910.1 aspartyl protease family protein [Bacteroidota bacterium]
MRKIIFFMLLLPAFLATSKLYAQEEFIEPPSRFITSIPFEQLTGGIILLKAQLDNFPDTLRFILDTGSSGISLDSSTVEYLKLKPVPTDRTIRGIAGIKKVSFLYDHTLHINGLMADSLNFHVNDYEILTQVYGDHIDGIIGYSLLSRYIVKVNYDSLKIDFFSRGTFNYPKGGYLFKPSLNTLPVTSLRLKDERSAYTRFLFDIGAGLCMMLNRDFVDDSSLIQKRRKFYLKQAEGLGGKLDMDLTVIRELKIGPYKFKKVPVLIFDDIYNVTSYPYLGGLIGNDVLRRFNVILNYPKRDIYLTPNTHFLEPFDYSYSGIELYKIDNTIFVGDVAKGSPAETAGIKEGDIVMAINTDFSQSLASYKTALQATKERVKVIIKRNNELFSFEFKVKSIL